jgi:enoyl-CoA hydratase/carnithine racemase
VNLEKIDAVFVLHLGDGENRYTAESVAELTALIAEVEAAPAPRALVTVGDGKFWSNGLDLDWMLSHRDEVPDFLIALHRLFATLLEAGFPTVAAVQGHAYAAGAMVALAHDFRIMREDRGYFCLPEVDIRLAFSPGMNALVSSKLTPQTAHEAMVFGRRYGAQDAATAGIVDETSAEADVLQRAIARASELADKDPVTLHTIKQNLYAAALADLRDDAANSRIDGLFS